MTRTWRQDDTKLLNAVCDSATATTLVASVLYNGGDVESFKQLFGDLLDEAPFEEEAWEIIKALHKAGFLNDRISERVINGDY